MTDQEPKPIELGPVRPYVEPAAIQSDIPVTEQVERSVLSAPERRRGRGVIAAGAAVVVLAAGGFAYSRWNGGEEAPVGVTTPVSLAPQPNNEVMPAEAPSVESEPQYCLSPAVEKSIEGDPNVTSDDPDTWTTGITMRVKVAKGLKGYIGTVFGYRDSEDSTDEATMSPPQSRDALKATQLMRTGDGDWVIVVRNVGQLGSAACDEQPVVVFKKTSVKTALANGAVEPI